jgi:hypothetical protein
MSSGVERWVSLGGQRISATLAVNRSRHYILALSDGRMAKMVRGAGSEETQAKLLLIHRRMAASRLVRRMLEKQAHPGLLRVFGRVTDNLGNQGYVCERLNADDPRTTRNHPVVQTMGSWLEAIRLLADAAQALHAIKKVHGDITPFNVCFRGTQPVLIDYELMVNTGQYPSPFPDKKTNTIVGLTPWCCSPEQVHRSKLTPASDVFCIILTALSWITGHFGLSTRGARQSIDEMRILSAEGVYPHWNLVEKILQDQGIVSVLERGLEPESSDRYTNGAQLAEAISRLQAKLPAKLLDSPIRSVVDDAAQVSVTPAPPTAISFVHDYSTPP